MGDSYPEDWIVTLDKLLALDFDTVPAGSWHGVPGEDEDSDVPEVPALRDRSIAGVQEAGLSADDAAAKVDVTAFRNEFSAVRVGIDAAAVRRIYQLADKPE